MLSCIIKLFQVACLLAFRYNSLATRVKLLLWLHTAASESLIQTERTAWTLYIERLEQYFTANNVKDAGKQHAFSYKHM